MNILITGGTGLIGRALCKALAEDGHSLTVLSRSPDTVAEAGCTRMALSKSQTPALTQT